MLVFQILVEPVANFLKKRFFLLRKRTGVSQLAGRMKKPKFLVGFVVQFGCHEAKKHRKAKPHSGNLLLCPQRLLNRTRYPRRQ